MERQGGRSGGKTIIVYDLQTGRTKKFMSAEECAAFYRMTVPRVLCQIRTGHRWKGLVFDII